MNFQKMFVYVFHLKVEKNLKGSLDLIPSPSPSVKIQIMGGKVRLRRKGKSLQTFENKEFVDNAQQCSVLPLYHSCP